MKESWDNWHQPVHDVNTSSNSGRLVPITWTYKIHPCPLKIPPCIPSAQHIVLSLLDMCWNCALFQCLFENHYQKHFKRTYHYNYYNDRSGNLKDCIIIILFHSHNKFIVFVLREGDWKLRDVLMVAKWEGQFSGLQSCVQVLLSVQTRSKLLPTLTSLFIMTIGRKV